jgi:hypothetical protein
LHVLLALHTHSAVNPALHYVAQGLLPPQSRNTCHAQALTLCQSRPHRRTIQIPSQVADVASELRSLPETELSELLDSTIMVYFLPKIIFWVNTCDNDRASCHKQKRFLKGFN